MDISAKNVNAPAGVLLCGHAQHRLQVMNCSNWLARPFTAALLTLVVALVPVLFAVRHLQRAAAVSDAVIFTAASGTVEEKLSSLTLRHTTWLNILRNRLGAKGIRNAQDLDRELPNYIWINRPPLWSAVAYVEDKRVIWMRGVNSEPIKVGSDIFVDPTIAELFKQISEASPKDHQLAWGVLVSGQRLCVAMQVAGDGIILGWLDLKALCNHPEAEFSGRPEVLRVRLPEDENPGGRLVEIGEGRVRWQATIARGPRYSELLAHPSKYYILAVGIFTAVLLATLAGLAAKSRQEAQLAMGLQTALEAEREMGRIRSQLISSVSHEFRTPLSVILSSAELLETYGPKLDAARSGEVVMEIQESAKRLSEMVDEILLLSRLESGRVQPRIVDIDLSELCHTAAHDVTTATRERCPILIEANGSVKSDHSLLRSMLGNLLGNAVKYSPVGSEVFLAVKIDPSDIVFTVSDNGIGIPEDDLARVGEAFHRAANVGDVQGTGLGLAIVRRSAALLGGKFSIESTEGQGTTAKLTLPIA